MAKFPFSVQPLRVALRAVPLLMVVAVAGGCMEDSHHRSAVGVENLHREDLPSEDLQGEVSSGRENSRPASRYYRADLPVNAEMRIVPRADGEVNVEIIAAAPEGAGAMAAADCPILASGHFDEGVFIAPSIPPGVLGYDSFWVEGDSHDVFIRAEQVEEGLQVSGQIDHCGLDTAFAGFYRPIDETESRLFVGDLQEPWRLND